MKLFLIILLINYIINYKLNYVIFGVAHITKEIIKFIGNQNIKTNTFRTQAYDSIMRGYFCIGFINFMFKGKILTDYTNFFSPNDFKRKDNIIFSYFKD